MLVRDTDCVGSMRRGAQILPYTKNDSFSVLSLRLLKLPRELRNSFLTTTQSDPKDAIKSIILGLKGLSCYTIFQAATSPRM